MNTYDALASIALGTPTLIMPALCFICQAMQEKNKGQSMFWCNMLGIVALTCSACTFAALLSV